MENSTESAIRRLERIGRTLTWATVILGAAVVLLAVLDVMSF